MFAFCLCYNIPYMEDGEGKKKGFMHGIVDSFKGDNTHDATGGTVKHGSNENARDGLAGGEEQAAKDTAPNGNYSGADGSSSAAKANAAENGVSAENALNRLSNYVNNVKGDDSNGEGNGKGFLGHMFKKRGPVFTIALIIMFIAGFGSFSMLGLATLPLSIIAQFQGIFDSKGASNFVRTNKTIRWMMHPETRNMSEPAQEFVRQHSKIYQKITGSDENYFHITKYQAHKLKKKGIDVEEVDGVGQILVYHKDVVDEDGTTHKQRIEVVADENQATGGRRYIKEIYENDVGFHDEYHEGTATWRKGVKDWYNKVSEGFFKRVDIIRNRFKDFIAGIFHRNTEDFENTVDVAVGTDTLHSRTGDQEYHIEDEEEVHTKPDGSTETVTVEKVGPGKQHGELNLKRKESWESVSKKLNDFSTATATKIAGVASKAMNLTCAAAEVLTAINLLVIAFEVGQILKMTSTIFEGIQKTQDSNVTSKESPVNDIGTSLSKPKTTYYHTVDSGKDTVEITGTAMEADAMVSIYEDRPVNMDDVSVNSFNLTDANARAMDHIFSETGTWQKIMGAVGGIAGAVGSSFAAYKACTFAKLGAAAVDMVLDALDVLKTIGEIGVCILGAVETAGTSCAPLIKTAIVKIAIQVGAAVLVAAIASAVTSFIVGKVVTMLARDLTSDIGGVDYGNALVSGANIYMGKSHQNGGGSLATKETYLTHLNNNDKYIAEEARYQRSTRSPFDASSPYTFMGSLMSKMSPLFSSSGSILPGLSNMTSVVGNSIASIMPGASAASNAITAEAAAENAKRCPELEAIGAVSDAFCNPLYTTDYNTTEIDPGEIAYDVSIQPGTTNFIYDNDGVNTEINTDLEESHLMQYLVFCEHRDSPFGYADMNIANAINSGAPPAIQALPVWGSITDITQNTDMINHFGLISGQACVTRGPEEGLGSDTFTWKEAKYYQRYIEDQSLAENMGLIEKSSVTVAMEKYYEEHPIDYSFEGLLAMQTGMPKEKVQDTLALMEGLIWIANYDPTGMYPYSVEPAEEDNKIEVKNEEDHFISVINVQYNKDNYYLRREEFSIA